MKGITDLLAELDRVVGEQDEYEPIPYWLSTPLPNLNLALSGREDGGFPGGRIITISGPESSGKTALATEALISCQKMDGMAGFDDVEHSFHHGIAERRGLKVAKGDPFYYKKTLNGEEAFQVLYDFMDVVRSNELGLPTGKKEEKDEERLKRRDALFAKLRKCDRSSLMPLAMVVDSIASMIPRSQDIRFENQNMKTKNMDHAAMMSLELKKVARDADIMQATVFLLNQLRTNPGVMFGDKSTEPGGNAPKYYASIMARLRRTDKLFLEWGNPKSPVIGDVVELTTRKNKVHRPFISTRYVFRTVDPVGLDPVMTMIVLGKDAGVLGSKDGKSCDFKGTKMTVERMEDLGRTQPKFLEELTAHVMATAAPVVAGDPIDEEDDAPALPAIGGPTPPPAGAFSKA